PFRGDPATGAHRDGGRTGLLRVFRTPPRVRTRGLVRTQRLRGRRGGRGGGQRVHGSVLAGNLGFGGGDFQGVLAYLRVAHPVKEAHDFGVGQTFIGGDENLVGRIRRDALAQRGGHQGGIGGKTVQVYPLVEIHRQSRRLGRGLARRRGLGDAHGNFARLQQGRRNHHED